jgi:hypothetical protein
MMKIEHLIDVCWGDDSEHQDYLNRKAKEGWELCNIVREKESTYYKYFFRRYVRSNVLNDFFNSKSDANKYLTAEQQEDLENDFYRWYQNAP